MVEELNLDGETVRKILTEDLGMRKVSAKMVPHILSDDQKQRRLDVCSDLSRQLAKGKNFLDGVISGDESWCFQYDPETKRQSMQWKTSVSQAQVKTMLICFFDHKGIFHFEFLEQGRTVNQHCYLEILARLCEAVRWRRPELWPDAWILHHVSAPAHDALALQEFLDKKTILKLDHPPYSPDLPPCDFRLFPKLKTALKGHRFSDIADIQGHATTMLKGIPEEEFQKCFEK
jgi:histone-lysine N-methyltransferase SETMAR